MPPRITILCPMGVERKAIRACARGRARIVQTGIGHAPVARSVGENAESTDVFLLVGFAGSISPDTDHAPPVARIIDEFDRAEWIPTIIPPGDNPATLLTLKDPACTVESKSRLASRFPDAVLIDMEASSFARAVGKHSISRWGVVRAVSDGPDETLPDDVASWLDDRGNTRLTGVAHSLLRARTTIGELSRLAKAMKSASRHLAEATDHALGFIESDAS